MDAPLAACPLALLLVAGVGERLRPLTNDRPKALVSLGDETILARVVRQLLDAGVRELVVATGYCEDAVKAALAGCPVPVRYCRNEAFDRTQNSVSLALCREAVAGRAFVKLDGDLVVEPEVFARMGAAPAAGLVAAVDRGVRLGAEEMKVALDGTRIVDFGKHLELSRAGGESIGIERVSGAAVSLLFHALDAAGAAGRTGLYYEDVYAGLIGAGLEASMADVTGLRWTEVDTAADLERARSLVSSGPAVTPRALKREPTYAVGAFRRVARRLQDCVRVGRGEFAKASERSENKASRRGASPVVGRQRCCRGAHACPT